MYCVTLPTSTAVVLVDCGSCVLYTTYPSASVAFTAVQLMVALVAFLWSRVSPVGVKLGAIKTSTSYVLNVTAQSHL